MAVIEKDLGAVSAYAIAVEHGYQGTEAEFAELLTNTLTYAQNAANSAAEAAVSKAGADTAKGLAETAQAAAEAAETGAISAKNDAITAKNTAVSAQATATGAAQDANLAKTGAQAAQTAAQTAQGKAEDAQEAAEGALQEIIDERDDQIAAIEAKGEEVVESIPPDYTELSDEVSDLKSQTNAIIYGGNATKQQTPTIIDGYTVNVANNGALMSTTYYNYSDFMAIPDYAISISVHATFTGTFGLAYYNTNTESGFVGGVDGDHISDYGGTDKSEPQTVVLPVPAAARYFRATMRNAYYTKPDDYAIQFIIPIESIITAENTIAKHTDEIENVNDDIKTIADYHYSKNLLDESQAEAGFITNNGTITTSGSFGDYLTSDFVAVEANKTYFVGVFSSSGVYSDSYRKGFLLYDTNKSFISNTYQNTTSALSFTPSANGFVRVSWANENLCMIELGNTHTDYTPYEKALLLNDDFPMTETMREEVAGIASNVLFNKKWAHCGDSFSHYTNKSFESGQFAGKNMTFPRLIADRNGMTLLQDFMLSGRTMAYPADGTFTNALTAPNQTYNYQNIPSDTDYITIMLGINDCQHVGSGSTGDGEDATGVITLGTIDDTTINTYYGAYNTVLSWLRANRPFAHVGIVVTNGTTRQDYTEAQIAVAKKWGYPYINLNGDERTPAFIRCYNPDVPTALKDELMQIQGVNNPTDTHPNWQTHELESNIIEAWLRSL